MSITDELRDPWGWLLGAVSGGLGWAVVGAGAVAAPVAVAAGVGIGAVVLGTKAVIGAASNRSDDTATDSPRDRLPAPPRNSEQAALLDRAVRAVANTQELAQRPSDRWLRGEASSVARQAEDSLDSLTDLAGRITLLDQTIATADPRRVAREVASVQEQLQRTRDSQVRSDQQQALAALDAQAESIRRLLARRDGLLAQLRMATVNLEGLATRTGELVALGPGSMRSEAALEIIGELTTSLDTVRAGIDEARRVLGEL
ncbi:MAG: hypothetical protein ACOYEV_14485 [Candidatus Nanopelagicales bacterium]